MTPRPPCCAMAMASADSVTVSIAALSERHVQADVAREAGARRRPALGRTCECCGTSRTSSKVRAVVRPVSICSAAERPTVRLSAVWSWSSARDRHAKADIRRRPSSERECVTGAGVTAGPVALLVLLAAAARAGVVAADLGLVAPHRLDRRVVAADARRARRPSAPRGAELAGRRRRRRRRLLGVAERQLRRPRRRRGAAARPGRPAAPPSPVSIDRPQPPQVADDLLVDAAPSWPGRARSSPSCTRPADRAGRSRAGRCLPSGGRGCRGDPSTAVDDLQHDVALDRLQDVAAGQRSCCSFARRISHAPAQLRPDVVRHAEQLRPTVSSFAS